MQTVSYEDKLLKIKRYEYPPQTDKRFVEAVDPSKFTEQQKKCFLGMCGEVTKTHSTITVFSGYAGTGKTFTISALVEHLLFTYPKLRIAQIAPTNKAVKVMREMAPYSHPNLKYLTAHSMLGLREKIDGFGKITYVQEFEEACTVGEYDLVICDESSMLSDELFALLIPYYSQGLKTAHLIFVGDPLQIPPINKEDSMPFDEEVQEAYSMEVFTLTDIVRQSADNPIIKIAKKVRDFINRDTVLPIREDSFNEETLDGVFFLDVKSKEFFYKLLETYFRSENFYNNSDFVKVVAYTNKTVNAFNRIIRGFIYGSGVPKICIGEKMIADKPIKSLVGDVGAGDMVLFSTNEEFTVLSYTIDLITYRGAEFKYYNTIVEKKTLSGRSEEVKIKIIHEDSQDDFDMVVAYLKEAALGEKRGSFQAASAWENYYKFFEVFAQVKYNYAITCHKSQGSTYQNVIAMEQDIDKNRRIKERNRIKYTAFTRPINKLFIVS